MAKRKHTEFMIGFIQDYLSGEASRLDFDLDFTHYLIEHFPGMEREDPVTADCFACYFGDLDFDFTDPMADTEHMEIVRRQFKKFSDATQDHLG